MAAFSVVQELCFPESGLAVTAGDGVCVCFELFIKGWVMHQHLGGGWCWWWCGGGRSVSFLCQCVLGIFTALRMRILCADMELRSTEKPWHYIRLQYKYLTEPCNICKTIYKTRELMNNVIPLKSMKEKHLFGKTGELNYLHSVIILEKIDVLCRTFTV